MAMGQDFYVEDGVFSKIGNRDIARLGFINLCGVFSEGGSYCSVESFSDPGELDKFMSTDIGVAQAFLVQDGVNNILGIEGTLTQEQLDSILCQAQLLQKSGYMSANVNPAVDFAYQIPVSGHVNDVNSGFAYKSAADEYENKEIFVEQGEGRKEERTDKKYHLNYEEEAKSGDRGYVALVEERDLRLDKIEELMREEFQRPLDDRDADYIEKLQNEINDVINKFDDEMKNLYPGYSDDSSAFFRSPLAEKFDNAGRLAPKVGGADNASMGVEKNNSDQVFKDFIDNNPNL